MATINRQVRKYRDLNLLFEAHPYTKDVLTKVNTDAIKTSVINLVQTMNYERLFHPEIGCQVRSLLFEPFIPSTVTAIKKSIKQTIDKFEPRANIIDIVVEDDSEVNGVRIEITFSINNLEQPVTAVTTLSRVR